MIGQFVTSKDNVRSFDADTIAVRPITIAGGRQVATADGECQQ